MTKWFLRLAPSATLVLGLIGLMEEILHRFGTLNYGW